MRHLRTLIIFDKGGIGSTAGWQAVHESLTRSIQSIDFPTGSGTLTLRKKTRRSDNQWDRNGVGYLKTQFLNHMVEKEGWKKEVGFNIGKKQTPPLLRLYPGLTPTREPITSDFGDFDFVTTAADDLHVAIEWETGNVSSSHRSMNKLAIVLASGQLGAGVLVVPSRNLYEHLTDRIGNIGELSGYLSMWKNLRSPVRYGLLAVAVVEHNNLTDDASFPYLHSGVDGRARQGRAKRK